MKQTRTEINKKIYTNKILYDDGYGSETKEPQPKGNRLE